MSNLKRTINIIGFQAGWWACVLGVQKGYPYIGAGVMALYLFVHLKYFKINRFEIFFVILVGIFGTVLETIFLQSSFIKYKGITSQYIAPIWIIAMWLGFSATLNHSLSWLDGKWLLAFLGGAIFGPLSYLAGIKFGAIAFEVSVFSIAVLSSVWGLAMPLLYFLNKKIVCVN